MLLVTIIRVDSSQYLITIGTIFNGLRYKSLIVFNGSSFAHDAPLPGYEKNLVYLHDLLKRAGCFPILTSPRCLFAPRDRSDCRDRASDQGNNTFPSSYEERVNGKRPEHPFHLAIFRIEDALQFCAMKAEFTIGLLGSESRPVVLSPQATLPTLRSESGQWARRDSNKGGISRRNLTTAHCATQNRAHAVQIPVSSTPTLRV